MRTMSTVAMLALMPTLAAGHGYISKPASRAFGCKSGNGQLSNRDCGPVQYEAQSVEGGDGSPRYPARSGNGIPDGRIASANRPGAWGKLDEQSATRWDKTSISAGWNTFEWTFTAAHSTKDFRYWITKAGWNPNAPLGRGSFEDAPFCTVALDNAMASTNPNHRCFVPARPGQYAVILGVWDVADTSMSFYNVIDVVFDGVAPPGTPPPRATPAPWTPRTPAPWTPRTPAPWTPPATPAPVPTTPGNGGCSGAPVRNWGPCKGREACCQAGWYCFRQDQWYSQCRPGRPTTPTTPATPAPVVATPAPPVAVPGNGGCYGAPVRNWGPCKGREACCQAGWYCHRQSQWYSQCIPRK